eukprot:9440319-Pyramimonas_sp.AAC.1
MGGPAGANRLDGHTSDKPDKPGLEAGLEIKANAPFPSYNNPLFMQDLGECRPPRAQTQMCSPRGRPEGVWKGSGGDPEGIRRGSLVRPLRRALVERPMSRSPWSSYHLTPSKPPPYSLWTPSRSPPSQTPRGRAPRLARTWIHVTSTGSVVIGVGRNRAQPTTWIHVTST